jgi:hypothetical protein
MDEASFHNVTRGHAESTAKRGFMRTAIVTCAAAASALMLGLSLEAAAAPQGTLNIYGFAQGDYTYDGNRVDPAWEDALRPTKIPTTPGTFGSNGQSSFSAKQSRFGVSGNVPANDYLGDMKFKFEFDLFGTGANAGLTTIRLRHAYGELGQFLAGQTNSNFMDIDVFPNTIEYWGPAGMIFIRNPQFRWTPLRDEHNEFAIAIEKPGNDIDAGVIRQLDPVLGANIQNDEKLPDLSAHWKVTDSWGHFQLAGILRSVGYDTLGTLDNKPKGSRLGWGINGSGHLNLFERDKLLGQVAYGEGISNYMNDGQTDLAPQLAASRPAGLGPKALPVLGALAYYDHYWNDNWSTSLGYSVTHNYNTVLQQANAFQEGQYASLNLLWTPSKSLLFGAEALWGERADHNSNAGQDLRVQFSVRYNFGASVDF